MEEARAFQKRIDQFGWKIGRVAKTAGASETTVKKRLKLLALIPDVQDLVASGNMPVGLAEEMACLDANRQLIAFRWLNNQAATPTRRTFASVVGGLYAEQCQESLFDLSRFELKSVIEDRLEQGDGHLRSLLPAVDVLPDLPERNGTVAHVIDRYAVALLETGHHDAAAVVLDLWKKMQESNYLTLPPMESEYVKWLSRH
jgi:ParB-like chromosome segregation protein Spo0J